MSTSLRREFGTAPLDAMTDALRATQKRNRAYIVMGGLAILGSVIWWIGYSHEAVKIHEARVIAGDFPELRQETGKMTIDENGRVAVNGYLTTPPLTVASMRLIPHGTYNTVIVANDGVEAHHKKTELVIGARDEKGAWFPPSAAHLLDKRPAAHNGGPQ